MKISQKLVSLRCRVLVKNKRLVVFWLLITMHVSELGERQKNALISSARQCLQHSKPHAPFPSLDGGQFAILSSSGSGSDVGDQHLPSPMAYGTHVLHESGYLPNKTHSNTAGRWRWHRKRGQTSPRSVRPGTHHTSGHLAHMASPPPRNRREKKSLCGVCFRNKHVDYFKCLWCSRERGGSRQCLVETVSLGRGERAAGQFASVLSTLCVRFHVYNWLWASVVKH